jgi:C_GCAxxG_C_C family probable redox protein
MESIILAEKAFRSGCNCSQAVLYAYAEQYGLDKGMALKAATGFGAGMGNFEETCGMVSGAVMVLGLRYGSTILGDRPPSPRHSRKFRNL